MSVIYAEPKFRMAHCCKKKPRVHLLWDRMTKKQKT